MALEPLASPMVSDVRLRFAGRSARGLFLELALQQRGAVDPTFIPVMPGRSVAWTIGWLTRSPADEGTPEAAVSDALEELVRARLVLVDDALGLTLAACSDHLAETVAAAPSPSPAAAPSSFSSASSQVDVVTPAATQRSARKRSGRAGRTQERDGATINANTLRSYASLFSMALREPSKARAMFRNLPPDVRTFDAWLRTPPGVEWLRSRRSHELESSERREEVAPVVEEPQAPQVQPAVADVVPAESFVSMLRALITSKEDKRLFLVGVSCGVREVAALQVILRRHGVTRSVLEDVAAWINAGGLHGKHVEFSARDFLKNDGELLVRSLERTRNWIDNGRPASIMGRKQAPEMLGGGPKIVQAGRTLTLVERMRASEAEGM